MESKLIEAIEDIDLAIRKYRNVDSLIYVKSILKMQIPRQVETSKEEWGTDVMCPNCGSYFTKEECEEGVPYCKYCGQALSWGMSQEEEMWAKHDYEVRRGEEEREKE